MAELGTKLTRPIRSLFLLGCFFNATTVANANDDLFTTVVQDGDVAILLRTDSIAVDGNRRATFVDYKYATVQPDRSVRRSTRTIFDCEKRIMAEEGTALYDQNNEAILIDARYKRSAFISTNSAMAKVLRKVCFVQNEAENFEYGNYTFLVDNGIYKFLYESHDISFDNDTIDVDIKNAIKDDSERQTIVHWLIQCRSGMTANTYKTTLNEDGDAVSGVGLSGSFSVDPPGSTGELIRKTMCAVRDHTLKLLGEM